MPPACEQQLAPVGRLVVPVANGKERLMVGCRTGGVEHVELEAMRFVSLIESAL